MPQINILTFGLNTTVSYSMCIPPIPMRSDSGFPNLIPTFTDPFWEWKSVILCKCCSPGKSERTFVDVTVQGYKGWENVEEEVVVLSGWLKQGKPLLVGLMLILLSVE